MFRRIHLQLAIIHAVVFFLIVSGFGALIYVYTSHRLYSQVDHSLQDQRKINSSFALQIPNASAILNDPDNQYGNPYFGVPSISLLWTSDGKLLAQSPKSIFDADAVANFQPHLQTNTPITVQAEGHSFRVFATPVLVTVNGQQSTVIVQTMRDVDHEASMLHNLLIVISCGVGLGALIALGAGFLLARRALVPIRRSWDKQQQFVADASHELRTPLSAIQAQSELMLHHPERSIEEESHHISAVLKETRRMSRLVEDLLTLARSDSNQLLIEPHAISLKKIVESVVEAFQPLCMLKEIDLSCQAEGEEWTVLADDQRLHQLLLILLDNALKYTQPGGSIAVSATRRGRVFQLIVEDNGIGIAAADLPHVFDRFYRADKARTRSEGGTGLGLSIAKWIVDAHGWQIHVESTEGQGTRVVVNMRTA